MMREEFYQSQYGYPVNNYEIKAGEIESGDRLDDHGVEAIDVVANTPNESFLWSLWIHFTLAEAEF